MKKRQLLVVLIAGLAGAFLGVAGFFLAYRFFEDTMLAAVTGGFAAVCSTLLLLLIFHPVLLDQRGPGSDS